MASILDFLNTDSGKEFIDKSSNEIGESPEKTKSALETAMPMILGALKKKTKSEEGAEDVSKALEDEKNDGSILSNLGGIFSGSNMGNLITQGSGILGSLFGSQQNEIENAVSTSTGMETSKVSKLLKMAAPIVMGILGNQKRKDNVEKGGLSSLLGSVMGDSSSHDQSLLETFTDADKNKNAVSDVAGKLFGGNSKKGLKGLF